MAMDFPEAAAFTAGKNANYKTNSLRSRFRAFARRTATTAAKVC